MNQSYPDITDARVAFVQAGWHADIVGECSKAFVFEMQRLTGVAERVEIFSVPGAFEIPLQARTLARSGRYSAVFGCAGKGRRNAAASGTPVMDGRLAAGDGKIR